jgi:hypothetical protein
LLRGPSYFCAHACHATCFLCLVGRKLVRPLGRRKVGSIS